MAVWGVMHKSMTLALPALDGAMHGWCGGRDVRFERWDVAREGVLLVMRGHPDASFWTPGLPGSGCLVLALLSSLPPGAVHSRPGG